jgi:flagellar motor switch protein FliM
MAGPSDQDKLSDDWGLEDLDAAPAVSVETGADESEMSDEERAAAAAAEWAAMLEGGDGDGEGGADRVLNQDEIDSLLGFDAAMSN